MSGYVTRSFLLINFAGDALFNLVGVSPDAKVMDCNKCVGLAEYKAPIFKVHVLVQLKSLIKSK